MATSNSSSTTNIDNIPPSLTTISPTPNITSIKLTADNYPLQKAQLVPYFCGQELYGYLDEKIPNPLPFILLYIPILENSLKFLLILIGYDMKILFWALLHLL